MTTPEEREWWLALAREAGRGERGSVWWMVERLVLHIEALERNRAWSADILEKEVRCRHATVRTVSEALRAEPRHEADAGAKED